MQLHVANEFIKQVTKWAEKHPDISGALLVGSFARGNAQPESDIDICLLTSKTDQFIKDDTWLQAFGVPKKIDHEDWGAVKTLRTFFTDGVEVEFNFADSSWASTNPIDSGTFKVVSDGSRILYDPSGILAKLLKQVYATHID